jgi:hypothetical protein
MHAAAIAALWRRSTGRLLMAAFAGRLTALSTAPAVATASAPAPATIEMGVVEVHNTDQQVLQNEPEPAPVIFHPQGFQPAPATRTLS